MDPSNLNRWSARTLWQEAATLAFIRQGRHDIRPAMLLLFHAQDVEHVGAILLHGTCYLQRWLERRGRACPAPVLEAAAGDALAVMWCRRAPHPVSVRSRQLGIRNRTYFDLRTVALEMYQTRLHEARVRFITGTIYTRQTLELKIGPAPPSTSSRAAPGNAQQLRFPWAA